MQNIYLTVYCKRPQVDEKDEGVVGFSFLLDNTNRLITVDRNEFNVYVPQRRSLKTIILLRGAQTRLHKPYRRG